MKTLLINPPQTFCMNSPVYIEQLPLGILYIAAVLQKEGLEVEVLDALRSGDNLSDLGDMMRYGLDRDDITERIKTSKPDIVGISNPYSSQIENALDMAGLVKDIYPDTIVVLGGAHPTVASFDLMIKHSNIDICVRGEGEYAMRDLVKYYFNGKKTNIRDIPGIIYRENGAVLSTGEPRMISQLDLLPLPAYDLLDMESYLSKKYKLKDEPPDATRVVEMITSRGCPYNCIFCSVRCIMGNRFRAHSSSYVLDHLAYLINRYNIEFIRFNDDNISLDSRRFEAIMDGTRDRGLRFDWDCPNGIRADTLDEALLKKMKDTGCKHIFIAVESGDQQVLDNIVKKNMDLAYTEEILRLCRKIRLPADAYFVLGLPGETLDNIRRTVKVGLDFYIKYNALPFYFIATPLPGTELLKICEEHNYIVDKVDLKDLPKITQGKAIIQTPEFTASDVNAILNSAMKAVLRIKLKKLVLLLFTDTAALFRIVIRKFKSKVAGAA